MALRADLQKAAVYLISSPFTFVKISMIILLWTKFMVDPRACFMHTDFLNLGLLMTLFGMEFNSKYFHKRGQPWATHVSLKIPN